MNIMFSPTLVGKLKLKQQQQQQQQCFSRSLSKIISRRRQRDSFISSQDLTAPSSKERERERESPFFLQFFSLLLPVVIIVLLLREFA